MKDPDVLILAVNYNTYSKTLQFLESIHPVSPDQVQVILIDNSEVESPPDYELQTRKYPFLHHLKTGQNLGYFHGARAGLEWYLDNHECLPAWLMVCNVDICFSSDFFTSLSSVPDHQHLGVVAPSIISERWHCDYNPYLLKRISKPILTGYYYLYHSTILHNLYLTAAYAKKWILRLMKLPRQITARGAHPVQRIYAPHGACLLFAGRYFRMGGDLNLPNFLFGEEIHVAETAARLGLIVEYHPELLIHNAEHASVGNFVSSAVNRYYRESIGVILENYYS